MRQFWGKQRPIARPDTSKNGSSKGLWEFHAAQKHVGYSFRDQPYFFLRIKAHFIDACTAKGTLRLCVSAFVTQIIINAKAQRSWHGELMIWGV